MQVKLKALLGATGVVGLGFRVEGLACPAGRYSTLNACYLRELSDLTCLQLRFSPTQKQGRHDRGTRNTHTGQGFAWFETI